MAWPGVQPSPFGRGEAFAAQELVPVAKDELIPPKPFIIETNPVIQEEAAAQEPISPFPISPTPITDDS